MNASSNNESAGTSGEHSPELIAEDIERTRSQVDATLDALAARLSPSRVLNRAVERARERTRGWVQEADALLQAVSWPSVFGVATLLAGAAIALRIRRHAPSRARLPQRRAAACGSARSARTRRPGLMAPRLKATASYVAGALLEQAVTQPRKDFPKSASLAALLTDRPYLTGIVGLAIGTLLSRVVAPSRRV